MNMDMFYDFFWGLPDRPWWFLLSGVAAVAFAIILKTFTLYIAGYRTFGMSLLAALVAQLFSVGAVCGILFQKIRFTEHPLVFLGAVGGGALVLEWIVIAIMKGRGNLMDGWIGLTLGQLFVYIALLVTYIFYHYPPW